MRNGLAREGDPGTMQAMGAHQQTVARTRAERVGDALTSWVDRLPWRLRRLLPRELVGFAILGAFTFGIDIGVLVVLRATTQLPMPVIVSLGYVTAFGLNFVLNRTINFRSHAPVGGQVIRYAVVLVGDYLLTVGVTTMLVTVGLDFRVARLTAACFVATFTYTASRWWVFRYRGAQDPDAIAVDPLPRVQEASTPSAST
jgi:putative flippase GtrA